MYNIVPYTISQYPTHCVGLLHVKLQDGGVEFDAFVEIRNQQGAPVVPSAVFVDDGFTLRNVVVKAHFEVGRTHQTQWKCLVCSYTFGGCSTPSVMHTNNLVKGKCAEHTIAVTWYDSHI